MISVLEIEKATLSTSLLYARTRLENKRVAIPRTTLAIHTAVTGGFPDYVKSEFSEEQMLERLSWLSPILIAANDYCDIGLAAKRKRQRGCTQAQFEPLLHLENSLARQVDQEMSLVEDPHIHNIAEAFIADLTVMAESIPSIAVDEYIKFIELDSALFETAALAAAVYPVLDDIGIDPMRLCRNYSDLQEKYSFFLENAVRGKVQRSVLALHNSAMLLKVDDDRKGYDIDTLLGLPNLTTFVKEKGIDFHEIQSLFRNRAYNYGLLSYSLLGTKLLAGATHNLKSILRRKTTSPMEPDELLNWSAGKHSTTIREELYNSGVLIDLFA